MAVGCSSKVVFFLLSLSTSSTAKKALRRKTLVPSSTDTPVRYDAHRLHFIHPSRQHASRTLGTDGRQKGKHGKTGQKTFPVFNAFVRFSKRRRRTARDRGVVCGCLLHAGGVPGTSRVKCECRLDSTGLARRRWDRADNLLGLWIDEGERSGLGSRLVGMIDESARLTLEGKDGQALRGVELLLELDACDEPRHKKRDHKAGQHSLFMAT